MRIDSNAAAAGRVIKIYPAWRRLKILLRGLGVDAAFDGRQSRSCMRDVGGKLFPGGDADLFFHQVAPVNLFRDRVFYLDARVHFDEIKTPLLIYEELDRAHIFVSDLFGQFTGRLSYFLSKPRRHQRRWAFFDHLLVAPLNGTIAFAEMNHVSVTIGDNLKFDVMRIDDELLDVNLFISESFLRLVTGAMKGRFKAWFIMGHAQPAAASASGGFNHHRVTDSLCDLDRVALCLDNSVASRCHGHAGFPRENTSRVFVTHRLHRAGGGPDELSVAVLTDFCEMRILRQKPVAGMNRINVANLSCAHNTIDF